MGARDEKSKKRQSQPEPSQITELMLAMEREAQMLMDEMEEILGHPATDYALFPRISVTLRLYWEAKKECLSVTLAQHSDLRSQLKTLDKRSEREELLKKLEKLPSKNEEAKSEPWQRLFLELKRLVEEEFSESRSVIFLLFSNSYSHESLARLGTSFKKALTVASERPSPVGINAG